jgi:uncharacterized NAD-dependent epimerase/dehydratase family protein
MQHTARAPDALAAGLPRPYLIFLGEADDSGYAKTARGLRDWAPEACLGEFACAGAQTTIGLPVLSPHDAHRRGARAVVIGVANIGGSVRDSWIPPLVSALEAGLDLISGMHGSLRSTEPLRAAAEKYGRRLIDVRTPPAAIPIATGRKRSGNRLLTVGTDCALGKKYTALAIARELQRRGVEATFRATGQTGILIAGGGIPIDAVIADFVAGAAELLSPDAPPDHWDIVEGQGSLFHPSYAGVSLGLLHGTQPDVVVLCHEVGRDRIKGLEDFPTPGLHEAIELTLQMARRTNKAVRCAGVTLNTSSLDSEAAFEIMTKTSRQLRLPVADPIRGGAAFAALIDACVA